MRDPDQRRIVAGALGRQAQQYRAMNPAEYTNHDVAEVIPMRLCDLMKTRIFTVRPTDTVLRARGLMHEHDIHHIPVVEEGSLVGMLTERDVHSPPTAPPAEATRLDEALVRDVMSTPVASLGPGATAREAANLLRGRKIGCVPVVEEGRMVGIVTETDLLELLGRPAAALRARGGRRDHGAPAVTYARSRHKGRPLP